MTALTHARRKRTIGPNPAACSGILVLVAISAVGRCWSTNPARTMAGSCIRSRSKTRSRTFAAGYPPRRECRARLYLLTSEPAISGRARSRGRDHPARHRQACTALTGDNPVRPISSRNITRRRSRRRLGGISPSRRFRQAQRFAAGGVAMLREAGASKAVEAIAEVTTAMRAEEDRLFATAHHDRRPVPSNWPRS